MKLSYIITVSTAALLGLAAAAPIPDDDPDHGQDNDDHDDHPDSMSTSGPYSLQIGGGNFDINDIQSYSLFYANSSAYLGRIKYQAYSEPLIVNGPATHGGGSSGDGISFQSIHQSPTGWQNMYVVPHQSKPVGFSVPHGSAPAGTRTNRFAFNLGGGLMNNGLNLFYACQDRNLRDVHTYQIYWMAGPPLPRGMTCKGPLYIHAGNGCARTF
ncbi:uncharacterized protein PV06_08757 [Exophiala oligosperma]|uniref:Uncharacterized protein n=2 Tax=Chaetothyriales TaxID=34395 RepID=A0A0D2AFK0_9EURO|nr:uncharacterized protein PV06_08757 [Exophiala oligosperma]KAJ9644954.1 hypothetical protein H2204_001416 [Knufia peltigerae]KIW38936.1 hypothetical protein PV06_08757 [Exophiala oligosperma]